MTRSPSGGGQMAAFLAALKRALRAQGVTYRDLVEPLGLSEASVKRIFAEGSLSLERIGVVLDVLGMSLVDVARLAPAAGADAGEDRDTLTFDQESVLAADGTLFAIFHLLLFGSTPARIAERYELDATAIERAIGTLSELGLVERGSRKGAQLKPLKSRSVRWREDGPLRRAYGERIRAAFLAQAFGGERELSAFRTRSLTPRSQGLVKRRLEQVLSELDELSAADAAAAPDAARAAVIMIALGSFPANAIVALPPRTY